MFILRENNKIIGAFANPQIDYEDEEGNVTYTTVEISDDDPELLAFYKAQEEALKPKQPTKAELLTQLESLAAQIAALPE